MHAPAPEWQIEAKFGEKGKGKDKDVASEEEEGWSWGPGPNATGLQGLFNLFPKFALFVLSFADHCRNNNAQSLTYFLKLVFVN